ncbi:MAG: methylmalonyl Co-A mutase-associated GTPase MeaB [Flavisolibacter sp.]
MWEKILADLQKGDNKALSRSISFVENEQPGYEELLLSLKWNNNARIIGITGPPGAGKSTLVDALIGWLVKDKNKVAVLCVDPSSPFNLGAVLGDRIRMSDWYVHPDVYIRSLATRGSMGGLHPRIIEISDLLRAAGFDYIIVETVGVGQSEIEIAGLADTTVVVVVPEAGDEVQTMKAGLMEIADVFVVNKSDRPDADIFVKNLRLMLAPAFHNHDGAVPVIKTIANTGVGVEELYKIIKDHKKIDGHKNRIWLLAGHALQLIQKKRMDSIDRKKLMEDLEKEVTVSRNFNLYRFAKKYF